MSNARHGQHNGKQVRPSDWFACKTYHGDMEGRRKYSSEVVQIVWVGWI